MRPAAQDAVGHAFPHSEPLLVVVRCQVLGVCPQLWLWLSPVRAGSALEGTRGEREKQSGLLGLSTIDVRKGE